MAGEPAPAALDPAQAEAVMLEYQRASLTRLRRELVGAERAKIDAHLAALGLAPAPGGGAAMMPPPSLPMGTCEVSGSDNPPRVGDAEASPANAEAVARAHAWVIGQAFACGRSMSGVLHMFHDGRDLFSALPGVRTPAMLSRYGSGFNYHSEVVHDYWRASGQQLLELREAYSAGQRFSAHLFASVLDVLDAIPDPLDAGGGSVLDNTVVFWHSEFGHEGHSDQETRHPAVIAGGGGRSLRLGRYLRLRNIESDERVPHNRLLTSICHAVGLTDVDFFGDRDLRDRAEYRGPLLPLMV